MAVQVITHNFTFQREIQPAGEGVDQEIRHVVFHGRSEWFGCSATLGSSIPVFKYPLQVLLKIDAFMIIRVQFQLKQLHFVIQQPVFQTE